MQQTAPPPIGLDVAGILDRLGTMGPGSLRVFDQHDFSSPLASGSAHGGPFVIVPCSMGTVGRVVAGPANRCCCARPMSASRSGAR